MLLASDIYIYIIFHLIEIFNVFVYIYSIPKSAEKPPADIQNEVQDFSVKKTSAPSPAPSSKPGNKLDDTLSKLMKRKNCVSNKGKDENNTFIHKLFQPEPEPVVGKEKKRKKLDEIVLGLSAAKEQSLFPEPTKKPPVTPSVTVTPTSIPVSTSHNPTQKPFTITVTSVPSSAPSSKSNSIPMLPSVSTSSKDSFSSFLAQAEQQNLMLKKQQQQRKSYEAMIADISKVSDFSSKVNSYSHEAKVNKWLAEQNAALAEQPLGADYLSRRRRPRVDPTLLDWKKLTGDENVAVIHRGTGKKLTGPKAPTLKRLGPWLMENPMYDIDPKWSELVKERGNLSHDLQKRLPGQPSSSKSSKPGVPGRPPLLASPTGSTSSVSSGNLPTSLPSSMSFPSLSSSSLAGLNTNLLSGLSGLGQFDPKTNPLLMPFAGLPNMGALGSMGLGNLTNMNLFANLAGLGLPGLGGMDAASLASATAATAESSKSSTKTNTSTSKPPKPQEAHSSNKGGGSSSNIPTTNPFPFFFPNPSLLYTPLGLGGLNPFTLQPGMSAAAYDSLAQQCGILNGGMNPAASTNSSSKMSKSSTSSRPPTASMTSPTGAATSQSKPPSRAPSRDAHLQQLLLPPDTQILESISKAASSLDVTLKQNKGDKKEEKRKALENLRGMLPTDFSTSVRDKKTGLPGLADFTKLLEAQVSHSSKRSQEMQMKEALEQLSKTNAELMAKAFAEEQSKLMSSNKRPRESSELNLEKHLIQEDEGQPPVKNLKENPEPPTTPTSSARTPTPTPIVPVLNEQEGVDIEALLPPSTVVKSTSVSPEKVEMKEKTPDVVEELPPEPSSNPLPEPSKVRQVFLILIN